MKNSLQPIGFFIAGFLLISCVSNAADSWPQFRGATQQGWSDGKDLPVTWSETENVKWKTAIPGEGWSSPVIADGQVWVTTALDDGKRLHAICTDLATGKQLHDILVFENEAVPAKHRRNSYASPTPVLDGGRVYVQFGSMGTACLDAKSGRKIWENREFQVEHQNGPGGSPLLFKDKLLIAFDGIDQQFEVALNKDTGKLAWRSDRSARPLLDKLPPDMRKAYGTPVLFTIDGVPQSVTAASNRLYALDPETGVELWHVNYPRGFSNVPLPVSDGKIMVISTGFNKAELWAIRVGGGGRGDLSSSNLLWKQKAGAPDQTSPLLVNDRVYMVSSSGIASCLDAATGEIVWKERIGSDFAASPIYVDGRIYFFDCNGQSTVIEPGDTFKPVAKNQLDAGFMASAAVVDKAFVLRTKTHLYRIEK